MITSRKVKDQTNLAEEDPLIAEAKKLVGADLIEIKD